MGELLVFHTDGIYLPNGEKYQATPKPLQNEVIVEYDKLAERRFQKIFNHKMGLNQFGEPLIRVIWGWNRLEWIAGLMSRYDASGRYRCEEYGQFKEPKYAYLGDQCNRWMVEKWIPPEMYGTREQWEAETAEIDGMRETQAMGPYPDRGEYELSFVIKDDKTGGFVQLTDQLIVDIVDAAIISREISAAKRKQFLEEEQARKEQAFRDEIEATWDEAAPAFGGNPNSTQANAPMHNSRKEIADVSKFPAPAPPGLFVA